MKRVYQTKFGNIEGNCMSACLASMLELNIEDTLEFETMKTDDGSWWVEMREWLYTKGYSPLEIIWPPGKSKNDIHIFPNEGQICWAIGKSPRGNYLHAVLVEWYENDWIVCHDPHPSGVGLAGSIELIGMLVPLNVIK